MIVAQIKADNETILLLGLSQVNVERLRKGEPIHVTRSKHGECIPESFSIAIMYGTTEKEMFAAIKGQLAPDAIVRLDPRTL